MNPEIIDKIHSLVTDGFSIVRDVKIHLRHFMKNELFKDCEVAPPDTDRAFFPHVDIQNHINIAIAEKRLVN